MHATIKSRSINEQYRIFIAIENFIKQQMSKKDSKKHPLNETALGWILQRRLTRLNVLLERQLNEWQMPRVVSGAVQAVFIKIPEFIGKIEVARAEYTSFAKPASGSPTKKQHPINSPSTQSVVKNNLWLSIPQSKASFHPG